MQRRSILPVTASIATIAIGILMCFGAPRSVSAGETISLASLLDEMVDRDAAARWPASTYVCRQRSSCDPRTRSPDDPAGWFANDDCSQFLRVERREGDVAGIAVHGNAVTRAEIVLRETGVVVWQHEEDVTHPEEVPPEALNGNRALAREQLTGVLSDRIGLMRDGKIVEEGGFDLAEKIQANGYDWVAEKYAAV